MYSEIQDTEFVEKINNSRFTYSDILDVLGIYEGCNEDHECVASAIRQYKSTNGYEFSVMVEFFKNLGESVPDPLEWVLPRLEKYSFEKGVLEGVSTCPLGTARVPHITKRGLKDLEKNSKTDDNITPVPATVSSTATRKSRLSRVKFDQEKIKRATETACVWGLRSLIVGGTIALLFFTKKYDQERKKIQHKFKAESRSLELDCSFYLQCDPELFGHLYGNNFVLGRDSSSEVDSLNDHGTITIKDTNGADVNVKVTHYDSNPYLYTRLTEPWFNRVTGVVDGVEGDELTAIRELCTVKPIGHIETPGDSQCIERVEKLAHVRDPLHGIEGIKSKLGWSIVGDIVGLLIIAGMILSSGAK